MSLCNSSNSSHKPNHSMHTLVRIERESQLGRGLVDFGLFELRVGVVYVDFVVVRGGYEVTVVAELFDHGVKSRALRFGD